MFQLLPEVLFMGHFNFCVSTQYIQYEMQSHTFAHKDATTFLNLNPIAESFVV